MIKDIQAKTLLARLKQPDAWFGLYYYDKLDYHFPGLRARYQKAFGGGQYFAPAQNITRLGRIFEELCQKLGMATKMPVFTPRKREREKSGQLRLF